MRGFNTFCCFPLLYFTYNHHLYNFKSRRIRKQIYHKGMMNYGNQVSFWQSSLFGFFLLESVVNMIHVPPGPLLVIRLSTSGFPYRTSLDSIISNLMMMRLYVVPRLFQNHSKWTSLQSYRIWYSQSNPQQN